MPKLSTRKYPSASSAKGLLSRVSEPAPAVSKSAARYRVSPAKGVVVVDMPMTSGMYERMGELVGRKIANEGDVVHLTIKGLAAVSVDRLVKILEIDSNLVAPETTLRRRAKGKQPLTTDETERTLRLARITSLAENLFGDVERAHAWLRTPAAFLPDADPISPIRLSATDAGARMIESVLLKVEHGLF